MDVNGGNPVEFEEYSAPLKTRLVVLEAQADELRGALAQVDAERKRIKRAVDALEDTGIYASRNRGQKRGKSNDSNERVYAEFLEQVRELKPNHETFTCPELAEKLDMTKDITRRRVEILHKRGIIRLDGYEPRPPGISPGRAARRYRLV